jgi:hypothetical protein
MRLLKAIVGFTHSYSTKTNSSHLVNSLLYGSKAYQAEEKLMEQSYGKMLARGKYVHEIVHHKVLPAHQKNYQDLIALEYQRVATDKSNAVHLVGSWKCEIGEPDLFVHIWEYKGC